MKISPEHLQGLTQNLVALVELSARLFKRPTRFDPHDHFAFMALAFGTKQNEHARSVLKLGESVDSVLIARSMLEGLAQLLWAAQDRSDRPLRWRAFTVILDWRQMNKRLSSGLPVSAEIQQHIERRVSEEGGRFLTRKARSSKQDGSALPADPYLRNWYEQSEKEVFATVGGEQIYSEIYGLLSEYHHWRPGAFGQLLSFDHERTTFVFTTEAPSYTATALATAFQCLWQTTQLLNRELGGSLDEDLIRMRDQQLELGRQAPTNEK